MKIKNKKLANELIRMMGDDQKAIREKSEELFRELSAKQRMRLKEIIAQDGWPKISDVGFEGARAAWLIAQHSDNDKRFQKKVLNLIRKIYTKDPHEVIGYNIAYLQDRVLVNSGQKQIYGTQLLQDKKTGKWEPKPIRDRRNVDKRRNEFNLPPLNEYVKGHAKAVKEFNKK